MINWYAAIMSIVRLCNTHELKSIVHVLFQWDKVLPVGFVHLSQQSSHSNQRTTASAQGTRPPAVPRLQGNTGSLFDVIFVCVCVCACVCVCTITSAQGTHPPAVPHLQGKNWPLFDLISVCVCVCVINMWCINMYKSLSVYEQVCMCGWTKLTIGVHGVLVECTRLCWSFIPVERVQLLVEAVWDYKTVWICPQYAHLHALKQ